MNRTASSAAPSPKMVVVVYMLSLAIAASAWFAIRMAVGVNGDPGYPPAIAAALRFSIAAGCFWLGWWWTAKPGEARPSLRPVAWIIAAGGVSSIGHVTSYAASHSPGVTAGMTTVFLATCTVGSALVAWATRIEKLTCLGFVGSVAACLGVAVAFGKQLNAPETASPLLLLFIATCVFSVTNVVLKAYSMNPMAKAALWFTAGSAVLWVIVLCNGDTLPDPLPVKATIGLAFTTLVVSVIGFSMYVWMMEHVRLSVVMSQACITPIITLAVDALVSGKLLGADVYLGSLLVIGGVSLTMLLGKVKSIPPPVMVQVKASA